MNLFSYFCELIRNTIENEFGFRSAEKLTDNMLIEEYYNLRNEIKITLKNGKQYIPKTWANRATEDIERIKDAYKIYVSQNKNKIFKRISVSNIVEKSKKKERNISGENEEQPIDFEPDVVKKLTNLYNKLQESNIYPKRKMRDTNKGIAWQPNFG